MAKKERKIQNKNKKTGLILFLLYKHHYYHYSLFVGLRQRGLLTLSWLDNRPSPYITEIPEKLDKKKDST